MGGWPNLPNCDVDSADASPSRAHILYNISTTLYSLQLYSSSTVYNLYTTPLTKTPTLRARDRHTHFTMTLQGRSAGTACWLAGVVAETPRGTQSATHANCRKPALERLARHSLFDRYMKAQLRLAGGRRKLGRNGLRSDIPRECVDPPEYLRDLRDRRVARYLIDASR